MKVMVKKQIMMGAVLLSLSINANAQFEVRNNTTMGTKVETLGGDIKRFTIDFNTDTKLWSGIQVKGVFAKVYNEAGISVPIPLEQGKSESLNGFGNPLHVSDVAEIQGKFGQNSPVAGYFDIEASNQALGIYAGKYKKVELATTFTLRGCNLNSDPSFDIITFDPGNTGKSSTYKLLIGVDTRNGLGGSDCAALESATSTDNTDKWFVFDNYYTTGTKDSKKTVKLAELLGCDYKSFNYKTIYVFLYTQGTEGVIEEGKYDPVIVLDNYTFTYEEPKWINPAVIGIDATIGYNDSIAVEALTGEMTPFKFYVKDKKRGGSLIFRCNSTRKPAKSLRFNFAETGAIKAKDVSGNYTVDVPYTYSPCEADGSQVIMTVAGPDMGTTVDDDLEVTLEVTMPSKGVSVFEDKLEIDNGIRYFMDIFVNRVDQLTPIKSEKENTPIVYSTQGSITVINTTENIIIYSLDGNRLKEVSSDLAARGIALLPGMYIVSIGKNVEKVIVR